MRTSWKSSLMLFMAAFIWGTAFVAQSVGMDYLGPLSFNGARFLLGSAALLPVICFNRARKHSGEKGSLEEKDFEGVGQDEICPGKRNSPGEASSGKVNDPGEVSSSKANDPGKACSGKVNGPAGASSRRANGRKRLFGKGKDTVTGGICCGLILCAAALLQQYGILYTSVGKAGFITTLYIILVPFFGIFLKKKVPGKVWAGAVIAAFGMYLLCMSESFSLGKGDALVLLCAVLFAVHILVIDFFSPRTDGVELSCIQFLTAGILGSILAVIFEKPDIGDFVEGIVPLAYAGILSSGVAYTLQVLGQKKTEPAVASLILSLESVVSVLAGWVVLKQALTGRELTGCALVFGAVILVQLPGKRQDRKLL